MTCQPHPQAIFHCNPANSVFDAGQLVNCYNFTFAGHPLAFEGSPQSPAEFQVRSFSSHFGIAATKLHWGLASPEEPPRLPGVHPRPPSPWSLQAQYHRSHLPSLQNQAFKHCQRQLMQSSVSGLPHLDSRLELKS